MEDGPGLRGTHIHTEDTGISVNSVEIAVRALHQKYHLENNASTTKEAESQRTLAKDTSAFFPAELFKVDSYDVWGVMALVNLEVRDFTEVRTIGNGKVVIEKEWDDITHRGKFLIDSGIVRGWFREWRSKTSCTYVAQDQFEQILFPTWAFQDEEGWAQTTAWLCRNTSTGQIAEYSPFIHGDQARVSQDYYTHLHLPKSVIGKFPCTSRCFCSLLTGYWWGNLAAIRQFRNQLRCRTSDTIWNIVRGEGGFLSNAVCRCRVVATYNYLSVLEERGILVPELNRKKTVNQIVQGLRDVEYLEPASACIKCCSNTIQKNLAAARDVGSSFDGLTLECTSSRKTYIPDGESMDDRPRRLPFRAHTRHAHAPVTSAAGSGPEQRIVQALQTNYNLISRGIHG